MKINITPSTPTNVSLFSLFGFCCCFCLIVFGLFSENAQAKMSHQQLDSAWQQLTTEKWLLNENKFPFQHCFEKSSLANKVPLPLLLAVARGESSFNRNAVSKANAIGVMQIQWPGTAKHLNVANKSELFEPCANIEYGARYLRQLLNKYNNNIHQSLAAYNYGPTRISRILLNNQALPTGALWYSEYILDHHDYVMRDAQLANIDYNQQQAISLITFKQPYRAKAMVQFLLSKYNMFTFDWFLLKAANTREHEFAVRLLVSSAHERVLAKRQLQHFGFTL